MEIYCIDHGNQEIRNKNNEYNCNPATIKFQCIFEWLLFTVYSQFGSDISYHICR